MIFHMIVKWKIQHFTYIYDGKIEITIHFSSKHFDFFIVIKLVIKKINMLNSIEI